MTAFYIRYFCKLMPWAAPRGYSWSPGDFGQARIAALGWLASLAEKERPSRQEEVAATFRTSALKSPADLHAIWNWFYLCTIREDNGGAFEAARKLTEAAPHDPVGLWAYLNALGARSSPLGQRPATTALARYRQWKDEVAPMGRQELEHVIAALRELRMRRPELVQGEIIVNVAHELARAKRTDDEIRFYRDVVESASQAGQIAAAIDLAALRGDLAGLAQLFERYAKLPNSRSLAPTPPARTTSIPRWRCHGGCRRAPRGKTFPGFSSSSIRHWRPPGKDDSGRHPARPHARGARGCSVWVRSWRRASSSGSARITRACGSLIPRRTNTSTSR